MQAMPSVAAQRGLKLFLGKGQCVACHSGPNFSDGQFHRTAVPEFVGQREPDLGRSVALASLRASSFGRHGRYSDDAEARRGAAGLNKAAEAGRQGAVDAGRHAVADAGRHAAADPGRSAFRTPSLRNVAVTGPYMHNGSLESLADVVRHYAGFGVRQAPHADARLRRISLSEADQADLVAFLHTLTDERGAERGMPVVQPTRCDALAQTLH